MRSVSATVHGAISIVNAIATGRGATLGTSLNTTATVSASRGSGISINPRNHHSSKLIAATVRGTVPKGDLERHRITVAVSSRVPAGCGLKSSSAVSTSVAMACARMFDPDADERDVLAAGVRASVKSGVSITGAYDDVCGCYYGGFNVTHNTRFSLERHQRAPSNLVSVIFVPENRRRRNVRGLRKKARMLGMAWGLAGDGRYWDAMVMNGMAVSAVLGPEPSLLDSLMDAGAMAASLSGNGPAVAAVVRAGGEREIKKVFATLDGYTLVSPVSNKKAAAHEL